MSKFFDELVTVLKKDTRFTSESGELLRNAVYEAAMKMDEALIQSLFDNEEIRKRFFKEINVHRGGDICI